MNTQFVIRKDSCLGASCHSQTQWLVSVCTVTVTQENFLACGPFRSIAILYSIDPTHLHYPLRRQINLNRHRSHCPQKDTCAMYSFTTRVRGSWVDKVSTTVFVGSEVKHQSMS